MTVGDIWRRAGAIEAKLRREVPSGLPYQPTAASRGAAIITGADFSAPPPPRRVIAIVLEKLADAAGRCLDFEIQSDAMALLEELGEDREETT